MGYAQQTEVSFERTESDLKTLLRKHGAVSIASGENEASKVYVLTCTLKGIVIRWEVPMPSLEDYRFTPTTRQRRTGKSQLQAYEQARRAQMRALFLLIKAKLVGVEAGIETIENSFMADIVMPTGVRFAKYALPAMADAYKHQGAPTFPLLLPG